MRTLTEGGGNAHTLPAKITNNFYSFIVIMFLILNFKRYEFHMEHILI